MNQASGRRSVGSVPQWVGGIGLAVAAGVVFLAALGLELLTTAERVAVFWPASGIAAGPLSLGPRAWRPVRQGDRSDYAANIMGDEAFGLLLLGLCNAGEALLVAWQIERWFGPPSISTVCRVLGF